MANMLDYLAWRGDLTLEQSPWNMIDNLILASYSYNPFSDAVAGDARVTIRDLAPTLGLEKMTGNQYFQQWRELLFTMAKTERFGSIPLHDYVDIVDPSVEMQFAAIAADLPDGTTYVSYRGTDSTLVGWREDFNMSFESPVPAQTRAVEYLEKIAAKSSGRLRVGGHSKGGNLAAYAGAHASPETQARLLSVCSFDGPGLDEETIQSEGYARVKPVLFSVLPQSSIVGLLMNYHADYIVVRSTAVSILQHDAFTWQLKGTQFEVLQQVDASSRIMDETVHDWLRMASPEQRRIFVDAMFEIASATKAATLAEMGTEKFRSALAMLAASREMDVESRKMFNHLLGEFVKLGADNVWEMLSEKAAATRLELPKVELPKLELPKLRILPSKPEQQPPQG